MTVTMERSRRDFDEWYRSTWPRLLAAVALVAGDRELAKEAVAEALARALERWDTVGLMTSPEGWTYVVATNLLRRRRRRLLAERRALTLATATTAPEIKSEETAELWRLVASLPTRERDVVGLRYGAGMTEPEIAGVLGIAPGTVSATLNHARAKLRAALTIEEIE